MSFLEPKGALLALVVAIPIAAFVIGDRRRAFRSPEAVRQDHVGRRVDAIQTPPDYSHSRQLPPRRQEANCVFQCGRP